MIFAKESIVSYIKSQPSIPGLADRIGVTSATLYNIINKENISSELIAKLIKETGFAFEKAFEMKEETDGVEKD